MDEKMKQEFLEVKSQLNNMINTIESLTVAVGNQQQFVNNILQSLNMQIQAINQNSQVINTLNAKVSDIEINNSAIEDLIQDLINSTTSVTTEMQELKSSVEAMKFYSFNSMINQNI